VLENVIAAAEHSSARLVVEEVRLISDGDMTFVAAQARAAMELARFE
jgi:hypothetical protein